MILKNTQDHIFETYRHIRLGLVALAVALPFVLWLGGKIKSMGTLHLQGSMSAYYHASDSSLNHDQNRQTPELGVMRNAFVGILFAVGIMFFLYEGYSKAEDRALNAAGLLAIGVATFPMSWGPLYPGIEYRPWDKVTISLHGACALLFFLCIAYVALRCANDTLPLIEDETRRAWYKRTYKILGWSMILTPAIAFVCTAVLGLENKFTFFIEAVGVYVFAAYWGFKAKEIKETQADNLAARGHIQTTSEGVSKHQST